MRDRILYPLRPSVGERRLLTAWIGVALLGGFLAHILVSNISYEQSMLRVFTTSDGWFVLCGVFGALAGLYFARRWMGSTGRFGPCRAFCGMIIVTFMAALVGGSLMLPLYGTMFGPMLFVLMLIEKPVLAFTWIAMLLLADKLIRDWRRERESIFALSSFQAQS
ncbi:hypothetical protein LGQ03_00210 [Loktanella sp. TSTF-M6]|uniref:Uncharacterized protein n=1 Tax=Loktanella gaetbuli TaxID=2881335 RepID=A0ABS8BPJ6_9RHOB|nr:hypothetical protein [Loktanella gaetbuli]MCB5197652.1 hypothetical protein [Loktanella gaetbuli]